MSPSNFIQTWHWIKVPEFLISILCLSGIVLCMVIGEAAYIQWIKSALMSSAYSVLICLCSLTLFFLLNLLVVYILSKFFDARRQQDFLFYCALFAILILSVLANVRPISEYTLELSSSIEDIFAVKVLSLMGANALLYYFLYKLAQDLSAESSLLYVKTSRFKKGTESNYLKEKTTWLFFSQTSTVFYYLFSFSLIPDLLLELHSDINGIMGTLFVELREAGWTDKFWISLFTMLPVILLIRYALETPLRSWEGKRRL